MIPNNKVVHSLIVAAIVAAIISQLLCVGIFGHSWSLLSTFRPYS